MRFKFFIILGLIFAASFWWGGDPPQLIQTRLVRLFSANANEPNYLERTLRLVALKTAVNARLPKQNYVPLATVPLTLQQAFIAVEDNRFYHHIGIDISAILRASLVNLQSGAVVEGGSTITQQLVKNLFLTHERTFTRKLEEVLLAFAIELRYPKQEILEMYLNTIYFGENAYGIGRATTTYFNKSPDKLNLAEAALIAGLPNAPSLYSPFVDWEASKRRQEVVLSAMQRNGYIDPSASQQARTAPLLLSRSPH